MFKRKTVSDIVAPIQRIVDELHSHAETHTSKATKHFALSDHHMSTAHEAVSEASDARSAASKIADLISPA